MRPIVAHRLAAPISYHRAHAVQREMVARRRAGSAPDTLLLLQHDPVFTLGRLQASAHNVLASPEQIAAAGRTDGCTRAVGVFCLHRLAHWQAQRSSNPIAAATSRSTARASWLHIRSSTSTGFERVYDGTPLPPIMSPRADGYSTELSHRTTARVAPPRYVSALEQTMIETAAVFGVQARAQHLSNSECNSECFDPWMSRPARAHTHRRNAHTRATLALPPPGAARRPGRDWCVGWRP